MRVSILGALPASYREVLTPECLQFLSFLHGSFEPTRQALLAARRARQVELDAGVMPDFLASTRAIREDPTWRVASAPADLSDRRVEITGPTDRKMVINGLNSGANTYMADFEDSQAPTWANSVQGQINLRDAVRGTISFVNKKTGKQYRLKKADTATLLVRPRGWHLDEAHVEVDGASISGSLFDFGVFFFHNAEALLAKGSGPYFYVPKIESHLEARLWNDVFCAAQDYVGVPRGSVRATALLETITAAYEMEEILYELRDHSSGLNCGRWDYVFSFIKKFRAHPDKLTPDRSFMSMETPFMRAYVDRLINVCHRRGAYAMGGMAAQIPVKNDRRKQEAALRSVAADKLREVRAGHDGTWVAHPALVKVARDVFDREMSTPNQVHRVPQRGGRVRAADLVAVPDGARTREGLLEGVKVVLLYSEAFLRGVGCIPVNHKMEDAATAEISRLQIWQWQHHGARMDDGRRCDADAVHAAVRSEAAGLWGPPARRSRTQALAAALVSDMLTADVPDDFLTTVCYPHIVSNGGGASRL